MNIQQAIAQLESAVRGYAATDAEGMPLIPSVAQRPLYLIGPPGVGKTAIVAQVAARLGVALVSYTMTHHTRQSALGLPRIVERLFDGEARAYTEYTVPELLSGIHRRMEETGLRRGILFLDEINSVSETLEPALLELLQRKRFGQYPLPEGWVIVCAGNPERYNRSARALDPVALDRLRVIRIEPELNAWLDYAAERGVDAGIRGYLRLRPGDLFAQDGDAIVSPRSWTDLSDAMRAMRALGEEPDRALFEQYLQCPEVAEGFALHWSMCRGVSERFQLEDVLRGRDEAAERHFAQSSFDEALCAAMLLSSALNERASAADEAAARAERLGSFVSGALRQGGDVLAACREQIARRERALEVRRRAGALEPREEAQERALLRECKRATAAAAGSEDAARSLQDCQSARKEQAQALLPRLRTDFECALEFAARAFANVHARAIFLSELERNPASRKLLQSELPEPLEALRQTTDPTRRAEALRRAISD